MVVIGNILIGILCVQTQFEHTIFYEFVSTVVAVIFHEKKKKKLKFQAGSEKFQNFITLTYVAFLMHINLEVILWYCVIVFSHQKLKPDLSFKTINS